MAKDIPGNPATEGGEEQKYTGRRKAAAFLLALDSETAAQVMQRMPERDVALVSEEMTRMGEIGGKDIESMLKEYNRVSGGDRIAVQPMIQAILERALGKERAKDLMEKIRRQSRDAEPFRSLQALDAKQLMTLLRGEHPQVLALVISHLPTESSAQLIKDFPEDLRYEVIKRIASTEEMPSELVRQVDEMLEVRAYSLGARQQDSAGELRFKTVAQMLNVSEPSLSKSVLDRLNREVPNLANEITALMFVFEDIAKIDDKGIQKLLGEVDKADLALALKATPPELTAKLLGNLSSRARDNIKEDMEMLGPRPLSDVEEAQKRILQQVRAMEERGDIRVNRGGKGEVMI
jgi:flagellar motor switch protein FliG